MRITFIDCSIAGVSGDMLTAALIDAGAPAGKVRRAMVAAGEPFGGIEVRINRTRVNELKATRVDVHTRDEGERRYSDIMDNLRNLTMPKRVRTATLEALERLAHAEARVHGKKPSEVTFHDVGAADAIADIVGCLTAANELGIFEGEILASEVAVGKGTTKVIHGNLPLPAPAVIEILKGKPIRGVNSEHELTTPTGATLITTLADRFVSAYPNMRVESVGYGAGSRKSPSPNLVRVCLGEESGPEGEADEITVLETNLDNVTGEVIGYAIEKLMAEGALDVSVTTVLMKKGRPGFLMRVLTRPGDAERLARALMLETGTLGVRVLSSCHRYKMERGVVKLDVKFAGKKFNPRIKIASEGGRVVGLATEYEDAKLIAKRTGIPLREVIRRVEDLGRKRFMKFTTI